MPLELPNLDDRDFAQLLAEAHQVIQRDLNVDWTDLTPGDPGVVLLELFAYLTEQMIYRLNRLPRKIYLAFLRLLGVALQPPTAASVEVTLRRVEASATPTLFAQGTPITIAGADVGDDAPFFVLERAVELPAGGPDVAIKALARHCDWIQAELLGRSSGQPGQLFTVRRPPLVGLMGNELDLRVGVELDGTEDTTGDAIWRTPDGRRFRLWREVANFANLDPNDRVYVVDRTSGLIQFAPATRLPLAAQMTTLAAIPPLEREIRVWYARGGGPTGNVAAGVLTQFVAQPPPVGISVVNEIRARGGVAAETVENALVRGPLELYSLGRAVTARDFEWVVLSSARSLIARAKAYTKAEQWRHARPGTVQVVIVPAAMQDQPMPAQTTVAPGRLLTDLAAGQDEAVLQEAQRVLAAKSSLGITNELVWARYKQVWVQADVVIRGNEAPSLVKARLEEKLRALITPFPATDYPGWPFRQHLSVSDIYRFLLLSEPSIHLISTLSLQVAHAPNRAVRTLAADHFQAQTWYAGSGSQLFRSTNDGAGWELLRDFGGVGATATTETIAVIRTSPDRAGLVAVATHLPDAQGQPRSPLYVSVDCGETWQTVYSDFDSVIEDMAWMQRMTHQILLLATNKGLFEVEMPVQHYDSQAPGQPMRPVASPTLVRIEASDHAMPLYAVAVLQGKQGNVRVVVAAQKRRGVYLSQGSDLTAPDAASTAFTLLGLRGEDIRHLAVQQSKGRLFLWAASMALADEGKGCYRWQFVDLQPHRTGGRWVNEQWGGGSCYALAFLDARVLAVSAWGGVLTLDFDPENPEVSRPWRPIERTELPYRRTELAANQQQRNLFLPLLAIATNNHALNGGATPTVLVGGDQGVYRSQDAGARYTPVAPTSFAQLQEMVTLPYHWLFVSGPHNINVTGGSAPAAPQPAGGANAA